MESTLHHVQELGETEPVSNPFQESGWEDFVVAPGHLRYCFHRQSSLNQKI